MSPWSLEREFVAKSKRKGKYTRHHPLDRCERERECAAGQGKRTYILSRVNGNTERSSGYRHSGPGSEAIRPVSYETSSNTLIIWLLIVQPGSASVCVEKRSEPCLGRETLFWPISRTPPFSFRYTQPPPRSGVPIPQRFFVPSFARATSSPLPAPRSVATITASVEFGSLPGSAVSQVSVKFGSPY